MGKNLHDASGWIPSPLEVSSNSTRGGSAVDLSSPLSSLWQRAWQIAQLRRHQGTPSHHISITPRAFTQQITRIAWSFFFLRLFAEHLSILCMFPSLA